MPVISLPISRYFESFNLSTENIYNVYLQPHDEIVVPIGSGLSFKQMQKLF